MFNPELKKHLNHNFSVNVIDGAFFGLGMGFASTVTVIPFFLDTLTDAVWIIGFISSVHVIGWQLPQILTSSHVAKLRRYLPMVMWMTFHERWPFFAMALIALFVGALGNTFALFLAFVFLSWQGLGGGFTATAWQSMIGKIMPVHRRGTFWGLQAAAASIMIAVGGYFSGRILEDVAYPTNFAFVFFVAGMLMMLSMGFLGWTREPEHVVAPEETERKGMKWSSFMNILRGDANLRAFLWARVFSQFAYYMAIYFFALYGKREFGMDESMAGVLLGVMTLVQTVSNPALGWLGDRLGHRRVFAFAMVALAASAFVAIIAPNVNWLYTVFVLAGIGHAGYWTVAMTMTLEFGPESQRPYTIGLVNTLIAPAGLAAPFLGGLLADWVGFGVTFAFAGAMGLATAGLLLFVVREPRTLHKVQVMSPVAVGD